MTIATKKKFLVMNLRLGEFKELDEAKDKTDDEIFIQAYPKDNHKICYGRGYSGVDGKGIKVPCSCVFRRKDFELPIKEKK